MSVEYSVDLPSASAIYRVNFETEESKWLLNITWTYLNFAMSWSSLKEVSLFFDSFLT